MSIFLSTFCYKGCPFFYECCWFYRKFFNLLRGKNIPYLLGGIFCRYLLNAVNLWRHYIRSFFADFGLKDLFQDEDVVLKPSTIAVSQSVNFCAFSICFMKLKTSKFSMHTWLVVIYSWWIISLNMQWTSLSLLVSFDFHYIYQISE